MPSSALFDDAFAWLDILAVSTCASAGVLAARGKRLDLVGVAFVGVVSALGGGTVRDLLLGQTPVFWIARPAALMAALCAALLTFFLTRRKSVPLEAFQVPDAFSLGLFAVAGADASLRCGQGVVISAIMGMITGVFGGLLRDMLCRETPAVLVGQEFYATAALAGAAALVTADALALPFACSAAIGALLTCLLRLASVRWRLRVPAFPA